MRRLSRVEYDDTVFDLLLDDSRPARVGLPEDIVDPFDNDFTLQESSSVLVSGLESLANDVANRLAADPVRRAALVPCAKPANCMGPFVRQFGRRALRRPLEVDEVNTYQQLAEAFSGNDGWDGVDVVVRMLLQHPEFVYRVEVGSPTEKAGVFRLNDYEVATRLSYFLWGTTPDDRLLDLAESGLLSDPSLVRKAASEMMSDPRAEDRVDRFHAMWLGYWQLPHDAELTLAMREETRRLLDEVLFAEPGSWLELFTMNGTWIGDDLAAHYDLPPPGSATPEFVSYGSTTRQGILSHGSFLSVAGKFGDTSPTQRGILIRTRLLCQPIPPPPPEVNADEPPSGTPADCKEDRYAMHRESGTCRDCHEVMDPVGFGLENYDQEGRFRTTDLNKPDCVISGDGHIDDVEFNGPKELANVLVDDPNLTACVVSQAFHFAMGHEAQYADRPVVEGLTEGFIASGYRFDRLILDIVSDPTFLYRLEESP